MKYIFIYWQSYTPSTFTSLFQVFVCFIKHKLWAFQITQTSRDICKFLPSLRDLSVSLWLFGDFFNVENVMSQWSRVAPLPFQTSFQDIRFQWTDKISRYSWISILTKPNGNIWLALSIAYHISFRTQFFVFFKENVGFYKLSNQALENSILISVASSRRIAYN